MAFDDAASAGPNRLRRRQPELAQSLAATEYELRNFHRRTGVGRAPGIAGRMSDRLRRMADTIMRRPRPTRNDGAAAPEVRDPALGGSDHAQARGSRTFGRDDLTGYYAPDRENYAPGDRSHTPVGGQEAGRYGRRPIPDGDERTQTPTADMPWMSSSEQTAFERLAGHQSAVERLSPSERAAFEDDVLRMVREDPKWSKVHDKYPERMPVIMTYANSAYARELGIKPPPDREVERRESAPTPFRAPQPRRSNVVMNLEAAAERLSTPEARRSPEMWEREAPRAPSVAPSEGFSSYPRPGDMSDAGAFNHVRREQEWALNNPPPIVPPSPVPSLVSPMLEQASLAAPGMRPLIGDEGRQVLESQTPSVHQANGSSSNSPNRAPAPSLNTHSTTTPRLVR